MEKRAWLMLVAGAALVCFAQAWSRADAPAAPAQPAAAQIEFFEAKIRPILVDACFSCHSASAKKLKGNLRLDSRDGVFKGRESGNPAVAARNLDEGPLITAVRYEEESLRMPPRGSLPAGQIAALEAWVKMGAPYPATPAVAGATT